MSKTNEETVFLQPGDKVHVCKLEGSPKMIVVRKEVDDDRLKTLKGIRCYWFDKDQVRHEAVFNSKELAKV